MKKYLLIVVVFLAIFVESLSAQIDSVFWFAPPWITESHGHTPISICITSYDDPVTVTINQPANPSFTPFTFDLTPNSFRKINISELGLTESQFVTGYNNIYPYGICITSAGGDIGAYVQYDGSNSEAYTLKGRNALGTDFIIPMQFGYYNYSYSNCSSTIEIIASEDNTEVFITPSQATPEHPAGVEFSVTLMKGESYAIQASGRDGSQHLRNTIIHSTKPIAVNVSDDSVYLSGWDLVGDQILPVSFAGTTYVAIKNDGNDCLYFFPTEDDTHIYINGGEDPICTLNKGGEYAYRMSSTATLITSDKPILVFDLTAWSGEFGGTVLPQLECTGSRYVAFTPLRSNPKLTIVVRTEFVNDFTLTGTGTTLTAADFALVPGDTIWSYCAKTISIGGGSPLRITNSGGLFHVGVFDMSSGTMSYSYFSDYQIQSNVKIQIASAEDGVANFCEGETINMTSIPGFGVEDVIWDGVNNLHLEGKDPVIPFAKTFHSGYYTVKGKSRFGCPVIPDTVLVQVHKLSKTNLHAEICEGEVYPFGGKDRTRSALYRDTLQNVAGCDSIVTLDLVVHPKQKTVEERYICEGDSTLFGGKYYSAASVYTDSLHSQYGCDSISVLRLRLNPKQSSVIYDTICDGETYYFFDERISTQGPYSHVAKTTCGCDSTIYLNLTVLPNPIVDLGSDQLVCTDQATSFTIDANTGIDTYDAYLWLNDNSTNSTLTVTESGIYTVRVQKVKCYAQSSKKVDFRTFTTALKNDTLLCVGESINIQPTPAGSSYVWNTGSTAPQITTDDQNTKTYTVEVTDAYGCKASASQTVTISPLPTVSISIQNLEQSADTCLNTELVLHASSTDNVVSWAWNTGATTQDITVDVKGIYRINVTDNYGCKNSGEIEIIPCPCFLNLYNVFTPDGDGVNDVYAPEVNNSVLTIDMSIFNRWGRLVFHDEINDVELTEKGYPANLTWDGTNDGTECQTGVYYCVIKYTCKADPDKVFTTQSSVTLLR